MTPRYPDIEVQLTGENGNAFNILGKVNRAMRKANIPKEEIDNYMKEAMSNDYDNLLLTTMKWVNVN